MIKQYLKSVNAKAENIELKLQCLSLFEAKMALVVVTEMKDSC